MAVGAPKFERLPTSIRFGSSTAPAWIYEGKFLGIGFAQAFGGATLRNVPICARADAPGMPTATTLALIPTIVSARAACCAASPPIPAIAVASATITAKLALNFPALAGLSSEIASHRLDAKTVSAFAASFIAR